MQHDATQSEGNLEIEHPRRRHTLLNMKFHPGTHIDPARLMNLASHSSYGHRNRIRTVIAVSRGNRMETYAAASSVFDRHKPACYSSSG